MTLAYFKRIVNKMVRECVDNLCEEETDEQRKVFLSDISFEEEAVKALYDATERELDRLLQSTKLCAIHTKCVTLMKQDLDLVESILRTMLGE